MQVWHGNENQVDKFHANIAAVPTPTPKLKEKEREAAPALPRYFNSHAKSRNIERGGSGADDIIMTATARAVPPAPEPTATASPPTATSTPEFVAVSVDIDPKDGVGSAVMMPASIAATLVPKDTATPAPLMYPCRPHSNLRQRQPRPLRRPASQSPLRQRFSLQACTPRPLIHPCRPHPRIRLSFRRRRLNRPHRTLLQLLQRQCRFQPMRLYQLRRPNRR